MANGHIWKIFDSGVQPYIEEKGEKEEGIAEEQEENSN